MALGKVKLAILSSAAMGLVAGGILMGTASVFASTGTTSSTTAGVSTATTASVTARPKHKVAPFSLLRAVMHKNATQIATDLHISKQQLISGLSSGKSLNDLAATVQVPQSQLQTDIQGMLQNELQARVTAHHMTPTRETQLLKKLDAQLPKFMANTHLMHLAHKFEARLHVLTVLASELKMTRAQLVSKLKTGESIAQIATAQGLSPTSLQNSLTQKANGQINAQISKLMGRTDWFQHKSVSSTTASTQG